MEFNETIIIPIIISIVELVKGLGLPKKFSALSAVVIGILIGVFYVVPGNLKHGLFKGVIYGLMAAGLYSGTKNTVEEIKLQKKRTVELKQNIMHKRL